MFTEYRLQTVCRDDVKNRPLFLWWNYREFYNLKFKDNRNSKGLLTLAGMPKDIYFLFQAFLNSARPVVHLCGRHHFLRAFAPDNGIKAYSNARELQLTLNGAPQGKVKNGSYRIPDSQMKMRDGTVRPVSGIPVANVFFWKTPLKPGRNIVEVGDGRGHNDRMIIYQKSAGAPDPAALVQDLQSSNPDNPAFFIDRPVEAQGPVYTDVDGSSDNTFDVLPGGVEGADWIATRRLSDPRLKTDLEFRINPSAKSATVFVLFSTGAYPTVTLKQPDPAIASAAEAMRASLAAAGFKAGGTGAVWRDHLLNRAFAELWSRDVAPGEKLKLPGQTLDYVVMVRNEVKCIVTAGPTYEELDDVRRMTNFSTGALGTELANYLVQQGHEVALLRGYYSTCRIETAAQSVQVFTTAADLSRRLKGLGSGKVGAVFHAAAVGDFAFGKIWRRVSNNKLSEIKSRKFPTRWGTVLAELKPAPKIIARLRGWFPKARLAGWKYEVDGARKDAILRAERQMKENQTDVCVVNGPAYGRGFGLVQGPGRCRHLRDKSALFNALAVLWEASVK